MNRFIHLKTITLPFFISLVCICGALLPKVQAVSPAPDGGYANENTAEGENALYRLTTGGDNTAIGRTALGSLNTGRGNTAVGAGALNFNLSDRNTATGWDALFYHETGTDNTATGAFALMGASGQLSGSFNTADGAYALHWLSTGELNTANGVAALHHNTTGSRNTATGNDALRNNKTTDENTANGFGALYTNDGTGNTADGFQALYLNQTGDLNTATGHVALYHNTTGHRNTADGAGALYHNTTGHRNTAVGAEALASLTTGNFNTGVGRKALYANKGNNNIALGLEAGVDLTTGHNNIDIGNKGVAEESDTIRIGTAKRQKPVGRGKTPPLVLPRTFIAGIHDQKQGGNGISAVYVNNAGQLGTQAPPSSRRFKKEIKAMEQTSEAILALSPMTCHDKSATIDTPQFGLIAEEVEKVNPDLVVRDNDGKPYSVRYDQVNAMLLNEFLKAHRKVQEQGAMIAQVKSTAAQQDTTIARLQKQIEALTAGLQKVSDQLEVSKPAPQTVLNNQ